MAGKKTQNEETGISGFTAAHGRQLTRGPGSEPSRAESTLGDQGEPGLPGGMGQISTQQG